MCVSSTVAVGCEHGGMVSGNLSYVGCAGRVRTWARAVRVRRDHLGDRIHVYESNVVVGCTGNYTGDKFDAEFGRLDGTKL